MRTKRFVGQLAMIAALTVMTSGVMPTAKCGRCDWQSVSNTHVYDAQSSIGNPFDLVWAWLQSLIR
jgi:hypothetical protein